MAANYKLQNQLIRLRKSCNLLLYVQCTVIFSAELKQCLAFYTVSRITCYNAARKDIKESQIIRLPGTNKSNFQTSELITLYV